MAFPKITSYALVEKATHLIVAKGSKKEMEKRQKQGDGKYYVGIANSPAGTYFK